MHRKVSMDFNINPHLIKKVFLVPFFFFLVSNLIYSKTLEIDVYGITRVFRSEINPTYMANKIDSDGKINFNPGIGFGIDYRKSSTTEGFSPILKTGMYSDLNNMGKGYFAVGTRLRHYFKSISLDLNLGIGVVGGDSRIIVNYMIGDELLDTVVETDTFIDIIPLISYGIGCPFFDRRVFLGYTSLYPGELTLFFSINL